MPEVIGIITIQVYEFNDSETGETYLWDATRGREIALARNARIESVSPADFGMTQAQILRMYPDLNREKALALPLEALASPLLFVEHRGRHVMIDGWHRLYKAVCCEVTWLPAFVLSAFESAEILIGPPSCTR